MTRADRQTFQTSDSQPQKTQSETVSFGRFAGDASNADSATVGECRRRVRNSRFISQIGICENHKPSPDG